MPQTSYDNNQPIGFAGMKADGSHDNVRSYIASAAIPFGLAVALAATAGQVKLPDAADAKIAGIALHEHKEQDLDGVVQHKATEAVPVLTRGPAYVTVEEAVADGDPVYVRFADGAGGTQKGAFRKSADTATAAQVAGAVYRTAAAANGLAVVEFNLP